MNEFNKSFSNKLNDFFVKLLKRIFDLKNFLRILELILLLVFNVFYGKKPFVNWNGFKLN